MTAQTLPELTIIIVSYNTKELTLKCLETLFTNTQVASFHTILWDNASSDGSAEAIEEKFPQVELIKCPDNLGFAKANNEAAKLSNSEWLLLLNPDTEVHPNAIDNLLAFSKAHPEAGITGGRTVFPDGSLNIASCWMKITPWSMLCHAIGLTTLFPNSPTFNTEAMGGWKRDTIRKVDIVSGCFFMVPLKTWNTLGGFNLKYVMYGEEADFCLRAKKLGYQPMITPDAQIMHLVGASSKKVEKTFLVAKARATLIREHWLFGLKWFGILLLWGWSLTRYIASTILPKPDITINEKSGPAYWSEIWKRRSEWLQGYKTHS